jgi:hypothetical protein
MAAILGHNFHLRHRCKEIKEIKHRKIIRACAAREVAM